MKYTFKYPDPDEITADQYSYVQESISSVEKSLYNGTYDNFMDVESFARWLLAHDILGSHDAAGSVKSFGYSLFAHGVVREVAANVNRVCAFCGHFITDSL